MPRFTIANCREMAARSVAARKAAEAQRKAIFAPVLAPAESSAEPNLGGESLSRVRVHMDRLHELMSKAKTDREWDNLSRAYERLFKVWCVLTRTPGPGNLKPKDIRSSRPPLPEPIIPTRQVSGVAY
jgi:hypothetical protein